MPADVVVMLGNRRFRSIPGVVLAGLAVVLSGCASSLTASGAGPTAARSLPRVPLPAPTTLTRNGVVYHESEVAPLGAMRDRASSMTVTVFVFHVESAPQPMCAQLRPTARAVREDAREVVIATFAYRHDDPANRSRGCAFIRTQNDPPMYTGLAVRLRQPLGSRALVDLKTGRRIGFADSREPPTPSYLPAGYRPALVQSFDPASDFLAVRQYENGRRTIEIHLRSASAAPDEGPVVGHATVAGHRATITDESYERCVSYDDGQGYAVQTCSLGPDDGYLGADELIRIARSLHS